MRRLDNAVIPTIARSPQSEPTAEPKETESMAGDGLLADLQRELEQLEQEATVLEERLETIIQRSMAPEGPAETGDQRSQEYRDRRDELDRVIRRITEIPFEMSRTPAGSLQGIMIKIQQMETSLAVGAAESDVPLLASVSSDLARLGLESLNFDAAHKASN